jgi:nucleotide-binding universal stress UspA family protein
MSFEVLLSVLTGDEADRPVLDVAQAVASRFRSQVDVLHVSDDPHALPYLDASVAPNVIASIVAAVDAQIAARKAKAHALYQNWAGTAGLQPSPRWLERKGTEQEIARQGRYADLVVIGRPAESDDNLTTVLLSGTLEAALFQTPRPVIVAPPGLKSVSLAAGTPVAIAWNGSLEADRAIAAAMPFLQDASRVTVIVGAEDRGRRDADPGALREYLSRHGIDAMVRTSKVAAADAGRYILDEAKSAGAGLLVMGAYTHSRLREFVLGGVTRHVCTKAQLPVLMTH